MEHAGSIKREKKTRSRGRVKDSVKRVELSSLLKIKSEFLKF